MAKKTKRKRKKRRRCSVCRDPYHFAPECPAKPDPKIQALVAQMIATFEADGIEAAARLVKQAAAQGVAVNRLIYTVQERGKDDPDTQRFLAATQEYLGHPGL